MHFNIDMINKHFPRLSATKLILVAIKLLNKSEILQVFEQPLEARVEVGYSINKSKALWKGW